MEQNKAVKKNRILLVMSGAGGGIRTFLRYVYTHFNSSSYELSILAPDGEALRTLMEEIKHLEPTYIPVKSAPSHMNMIDLKFLRTLLETVVKGDFDLIHSQGFIAGIYSVIPALLNKTPHILTPHDVFLMHQFAGFKGYLKKKVLSVILPRINTIHCVSNDARANLIEFIPNLGKSENKCIAISNGINIHYFKGNEKRDLRKELNLSDDIFLMGFLGRFMSPKGFRYLVEALEIILKKTDLPKKPLVAAFGYNGFVREEQESIRKKSIENSFLFLPFAPNIASILRGLDVVISPSVWDTCPLLPMEAMVAGVPLIGTDCIGLREVLKNTPCTVVPSKNGKALAEAICQEMKNPSVSEAKAFREKAAQRFDVKRQAVGLEKLMLGLLEK